MPELTKSEERLVARVAAMDVSRLRWLPAVGMVLILLAVVDLVLAYATSNHPLDFWRYLYLVSAGSMFIERPKFYAVIQKLSRQGQGSARDG